MDKRLLFSVILAAMISANDVCAVNPVAAPAQVAVQAEDAVSSQAEDVTSQYLTNADFEGNYTEQETTTQSKVIYAPEGWTVNRPSGNEWDVTSLNNQSVGEENFTAFDSFKNPEEKYGSNGYWVRLRWGDNRNFGLSQTVTLPAGWYRLSADAQLYAENGLNSNNVARLYAGSASTPIALTAKEDHWNNYSVVFYTDGASEVPVGFELVHKAQNEHIAAFDNFKLERLDISKTAGYSTENPSVNLVSNGQFGDNLVSKEAWTSTFNHQNFQEVKNINGFTAQGLEVWNYTLNAGKLYTTIKNLPTGVYKLKMTAFGNNEGENSEKLYVYAGSDKTYVTSNNEAAKTYEVTTTLVGNELEIGIAQDEASSNWIAIDDVELVYMGPATNDAAFATLTQSLETANSLLEEKMGVAALKDLNAAIVAAKDITSTSGLDDINTAKAEVDAAVAAAKASVAKYAALKTALENDPNAEDAGRLDETGKAKYDALMAEIETSYENGTFYEESDINALLKNILLTGARAQTSDDADYTLAVEDNACTDPNVWKMVTDLADGCRYQYDTWAGEASGLNGKYLEYWIYNDKLLSDAMIENVVDGLAPGTYRVSMEIAVNNERTLEDPTGVYFYVNNDAQEITGLANTKHGGTAGEFALEAIVGEDGKLVIGFSIGNTTANWLAFKNCKVSKVPTATGINAAKTADGAGAVEVARYNAAGMKVSGSVKGVNIVKMSDGTVRKVILK